jgi:hypothetical protein
MVVVTLVASIMFLLFTCIHLWVWGILRRWSARDPTTYDIRNCREFEYTELILIKLNT